MSKTVQPPLVWINMEMTGLDPDRDEIIEIATIITDSELNVIARGPELVIHQEAKRFELMDDWNQDHHTRSGLWDLVLKSTTTLEAAEKQTLDFIKQHTGPRESPLCGNSIWQDRRFLCRHMQSINEYLHYRIIDVSSVKELAKRWYPGIAQFEGKKEAHRAMDDILESVEELKYYQEKIFSKVT